MSDNPYLAPQSSRGGLTLGDEPLQFAQTPQERNAGPSGLGGWLIVIGLKLVMTVMANFIVLLNEHVPVYRLGIWDQLTTPGTQAYHPLAGSLMLFETVGNAVFLASGIGLLVMYFRKSPSFPRWMIALLLGNVAFMGLDTYLLARIPQTLDTVMAEGAMQVAKAVVSAAIWVPYLMASKRVRNTFVRKRIAAVRIEPRGDRTADQAAAP